jgi:hypothetical protein
VNTLDWAIVYGGILFGCLLLIWLGPPLLVRADNIFRTRQRQRAWNEAVAHAKWEPVWYTRDGETFVSIQKVARSGEQEETVQMEPPYWTIPVDHPQWTGELRAKLSEARRRARILNEPEDDTDGSASTS